MHAVIIECKANHDRIHPQNPLELPDDWDGAALPYRYCFLAPFGRERLPRPHQSRVIEGNLGRRRAGEVLEFDLGVGGKAFTNKSVEGSANLLRVLVTDKPEGNLRHRLARYDGLRSLPDIASDHSIDLGGRTSGNLFDRHAILLACWHGEPKAAKELQRRQVEPGKLAPHLRR